MPLHDSPFHSFLTGQQRTILDAILFFIRKGELPTVREVGALVGLRSPATVLKHLRALEKANIITLSGKSRGIRLVSAEFLSSAVLQEPALQGSGPQPAQEGDSSSSNIPKLNLRRVLLPAVLPPTTTPTPALKIPLVGAIAAGKPFESYSEAFVPDGFGEDGFYRSQPPPEGSSTGVSSSTAAGDAFSAAARDALSIDPRMFVESGEVFALQIQGDSMIQAGILDGDYVIIRRQNTVEEGEIAAVIINGEGTLKRWRSCTQTGGTQGSIAGNDVTRKTVRLEPANEAFDPIEISEDDAKDVLVLGKYVGLVRGNLRFL